MRAALVVIAVSSSFAASPALGTTDDDLIYSVVGFSKDAKYVLFNLSLSIGGIGGGHEKLVVIRARDGRQVASVTTAMSRVDPKSGDEKVLVKPAQGKRRAARLRRRYRIVAGKPPSASGQRVEYVMRAVSKCVKLPDSVLQGGKRVKLPTCRYRRSVLVSYDGARATIGPKTLSVSPVLVGYGEPVWPNPAFRRGSARLSADGTVFAAALETGDANVDTEPFVLSLRQQAGVFNHRGLRLLKASKLAAARAAFRAAYALYPRDAFATFNWACAAARMGKKAEAIAALKKQRAVIPRARFIKRAKADKDLAALRGTPAFEALLR